MACRTSSLRRALFPLACGLALFGCPAARDEGAPAPPKRERAAAAEGAMCGEHGVLEALCTKCNPKLAPVFQAKGDFCEEHGLPESICPTCHPERGGKPAADVSKSEAPADGTKVRFAKPGTAEAAGLETAKAIVLGGAGGLVAPARIAHDATKLAHVNARSSGVVLSLEADVGRRVEKGDTLVVIDSPEVGASRARLESARSRVETARKNYERTQALADEGIAAQKSALTAKQELAEAKGDYAALAASLSLLGPGGKGAGAYTLRAPIAGVVTERRATIGELTFPEEVLFEIVDTSSVWVEIDVPESELALLALGQKTDVTVDALPGKTFSGKIDYVAPSVDPHTRTAKVRVALENPGGALRARMFGEARVEVGPARQVVVVPRAAIQQVLGVEIAFVRLSDEEYETRRIESGAIRGDLVEVKKGLRAGEEVVTTGSFLLKTETLKDSIGAGCCETD